MTESLIVDPSRLTEAGAMLKALRFPTAPGPIVAPGTDVVSAAINETLPVIESPVIEGLPAVGALVTRTGSSIVAAAGIYAEADQALSEHVDDVRFLSAARKVAGPAASGAPSRLAKDDVKGAPSGPAAQPEPATTVPPFGATPNIGQAGELSQAVAPVAQNLQSIMPGVQQAAGSMGSTVRPAQLSDDTDAARRPFDDEAVEGGDADHRPDGFAAGAAAGDQVLGSSVPEATPAGQRETAASEVRL